MATSLTHWHDVTRTQLQMGGNTLTEGSLYAFPAQVCSRNLSHTHQPSAARPSFSPSSIPYKNPTVVPVYPPIPTPHHSFSSPETTSRTLAGFSFRTPGAPPALPPLFTSPLLPDTLPWLAQEEPQQDERSGDTQPNKFSSLSWKVPTACSEGHPYKTDRPTSTSTCDQTTSPALSPAMSIFSTTVFCGTVSRGPMKAQGKSISGQWSLNRSLVLVLLAGTKLPRTKLRRF